MTQATLHFPISADPVGFHHLAAAEWMLRTDPELERVVFILSNGIHPDPTKANAAADAETRLELLERSLRDVGDPEHSALARQAERAGESLRIGPECSSVSRIELAHSRAVRMAESVAELRRTSAGGERLAFFAGSDLVRRMANEAIFSADDLEELALHCVFAVLGRADDSIEDALAELRSKRGVELDVRPRPLADVPDWLSAFLQLSSTCIRPAAEAGDPLGGMLPRPAAAWMDSRGLYRRGSLAARLSSPDGRPLGERSQLELEIEALEQRVRLAGAALGEALDARRVAQQPHTLALVETSAGGLITAALAGRAGASRYFRQSRFAYDGLSKEQLTGLDRRSSVSGEMVAALAVAMRREASTDFAIAESGMAGPPDGRRRSLKSGLCWLAFATPDDVETETLELHPFGTRREHQLGFALRALEGLANRLERT